MQETPSGGWCGLAEWVPRPIPTIKCTKFGALIPSQKKTWGTDIHSSWGTLAATVSHPAVVVSPLHTSPGGKGRALRGVQLLSSHQGNQALHLLNNPAHLNASNKVYRNPYLRFPVKVPWQVRESHPGQPTHWCKRSINESRLLMGMDRIADRQLSLKNIRAVCQKQRRASAGELQPIWASSTKEKIFGEKMGNTKIDKKKQQTAEKVWFRRVHKISETAWKRAFFSGWC